MFLPKPKNIQESKWAIKEEPKPKKKSKIPPYGNRKSFVPATDEDFEDGGAFPEIPIVQFPLGMGKRRDVGAENSKTLALQTNEDGSIRFDSVLHTKNKKIIHSSIDAMREKDYTGSLRPGNDEVAQTTEKTKAALSDLMEKREAFGKPALKQGEAQFIKYVPAEGSETSKIVRLSQAPVDPLEPPRFKHRKIPRSTGSPPPPVLRSPPRKVTAAEQANWVIPPCISNWKNAKGYTIPLDKRLANDGRGLQDVAINDNFAKVAEALYVADGFAREEVRLRGEMKAELQRRQAKEREDKLRELAMQAREERQEEQGDYSSDSSSEEELTRDEERRYNERQELRKLAARERVLQSKKGKPYDIIYDRDNSDRDISEKVALGLAQPSASTMQYDQRLFNTSSGISSGFGNDDAYNIYEGALLKGSSANRSYVPKRDENEIIGGVQKDEIEGMINNSARGRGFAGAEASNSQSSGPVRFKKYDGDDVFGVDAFMSAAKRGRDQDDDRDYKRAK